MQLLECEPALLVYGRWIIQMKYGLVFYEPVFRVLMLALFTARAF
jgi:hypothetical protein